MKKRDRISLSLILVSVAVLLGYGALVRLQRDRIPPEITMGETIPELSVWEPDGVLRGVTAWDAVDGDVSRSLVVESIRVVCDDGTAVVTYAAFDQSGNVAKARREVRFADYESPRFFLRQPLVFQQNPGWDILRVIGAADMLDGDISHRIRILVSDAVQPGENGVCQVRFQVTNSLGHTVELDLPVVIRDGAVFDGTLTLTDYLICLNRGDPFLAENYPDAFRAGDWEIPLDQGLPPEMTVEASGLVDTQVPGVYLVDYNATYKLADQVHHGWTRLIVVVEG